MKKTNKLFQVLLLVLVAVIGLSFSACQPEEVKPVTEGPESGIYYFDAGNDEYTVALSAGNRFTFNYEGASKSGKYTLDGTTLTLDFDMASDEDVTATLSGDTLVMEYDDASIRFLKKVNYSVTFNSNEGSAVEGVTVLNGKTVSKPADPTRNGYKFVGWYADSEFTTPYAFGSSIVYSDTTIYARWSAEVAGAVSEYTVDFDLGYDGAEEIEARTTIGGQVFDLPTPQRADYEFKGWWVSYTEDANALSYKYADGMVFDAHTTLFALWQSTTTDTLALPVVEVSADAIKWEAVEGASGYEIAIADQKGELVWNTTTAGTVVDVDFTAYEAGDYVVTVTAVATDSTKNASAVRYYKNNALSRVSLIEIFEPSMLVFTGVANAEKYVITVAYNGEQKGAKTYDNGSSTTFNFANIEMKTGGIDFYVTAIAEGYASSTSEVFNYNRLLGEVGALTYDDENCEVSWNAVPGATGYMVSVSTVEGESNFVDCGNATSISLKHYSGNITVKVYPIAKGYNSPKATETKVEKSAIETPANLAVNGNTISWSAVENATYEVKIGTETYTTSETSFTLPEDIALVQGAQYPVSVRAKGATDSLWSDEIVASYRVMSGKLNYSQGTLSWNPVFGVTEYQVSVNGAKAYEVTGNSIEIEWNKAGVNTVKVWCVSEDQYLETSVNAHTVVLDSYGGDVVEVQYKVTGDRMNLPTPSKEGFTFVDWYNAPTSNATVYTDNYFNETGDIVLYAHYDAKEYDVTYNCGNGGSVTAPTGTVKFSESFTLAVPQVSDATAAFGGWYSQPDGEGVRYTDVRGNSLAPWNIAADTEVYAFWIEGVLKFTKTKLNGNDVYAVMQGDRIAYVDEVTVPAYYDGLPVAIVSGNAFKNAGNLVTLNLPNTIQSISTIDTFTGCTSLENINVYEVAGNSTVAFESVNGVVFEKIQGSNNFLKVAVMPLGKTGTYIIPENVTEVPARAFKDSALSKVIIPTSVVSIGIDAFANNAKLEEVVFVTATNESALTIDARAFSGCTALKAIELPKRLNNIALSRYNLSSATGTPAIQNVETDAITDAFTGCTALTSITVAKGNKNYKAVNSVIYDATGTKLLYFPASYSGEFAVPDGTTEIANGAFMGCGVTTVTIPGTVTNVGECAFYGCKTLTSVTFEQGFDLVNIDKYAFRDCDALSTVNYEKGSKIASVGAGAFMNCDKLVTAEIGANVSYVGNQAYRGCTLLESVTFAASTTELRFGADVFYDCIKIKSVTLPNNVSEVPGIFSGCLSLEEVIVADDHPYFSSVEGVLFDKNTTELLFCPPGKSGDYEIPDTVTKIGNGVFRGTAFSSITIPASVTEIGSDAFRDMKSLSSITFTGEPSADTTLTIGGYAFYGTGVNGGYSNPVTLEIVLPKHTVAIGEYAFAKIGSNAVSVTMNEGLETIGEHAFDYTYIDYIAIPSTVKTIGAYAFYDNTSYSTSLTFAENSQLVTIGDYAFYDNSMMNVVIPASVEYIGASAFYYCDDLELFAFEPNSKLKTIGAAAFKNAGGWSGNIEFIIPNTVTEIGAYAFDNANFGSIVFEENGTEDLYLGVAGYVEGWDSTINAYANILQTGYVFNNMTKLKSVVLPARLVDLGEYAFYGCGFNEWVWNSETYESTQVISFDVTFAEDSRIQSIAPHAFEYSKLQTITLPKSLTNLPFESDSATGSAKNLLAIGEYAFAHTDYLKEINFEQGGTGEVTIGDYAFIDMGGSLKYDETIVVNLPKNMAPYTSYNGEIIQPLAKGAETFSTTYIEYTNWGSNTYQWWSEKLSAINVEEGGQYLKSIDGVLYDADLTTLIMCPMAKSGEITIPGTVTAINDNAFAECRNVTKITLNKGDNPTTIGKKAFYNASSVTEISLPENVSTIGAEAFVGCSSLKTIVLAKGLTTFDASMIEGCNSLENIIVADGNELFVTKDGVLFDADMTTLITYPAKATAETYEVPATVTTIGYGAFKGAYNLKSVVLPAGLKTIEDKAFYQSGINSITIPSSVTSIGAEAFYYANLNTLVFEEGGKETLTIGYRAFRNQYISSVEFPSNLVYIGAEAFYGASINEITFADDTEIDFIGDGAFANTQFTTITVPSVTVMGIRNTTPGSTIGVFNNNKQLKSVVFKEGLVELGDKTFAGCTALETVSFPASLESMGAFTFNAGNGYYSDTCSALKKVMFASGSNLEVIPVGTFTGSGLESITIPASVKTIADASYNSYGSVDSSLYGAFEECKNLEAVMFENGTAITHVGANAFKGCVELKYISLPSTVSTVGRNAFTNCLSIESIVIPETVTQFGFEAFSAGTNADTQLSSVIINSKATELSFGMFRNLKNLKTLVIPDTVKIIGDYCFENSGLEEIVIPETVTKVGAYAFSGCTSLKKVTILAKIDVLPRNFFLDCTALETVILPDTITTIEVDAFKNCSSFKTLEIPASLTTLKNAFAGSGLEGYTVADGNPVFSAIDGVLLSADGTAIMSYPAGKADTTYVVPNTITAIADELFANNTIIKEIIFEEGGTTPITIGTKAFAGSVVEKVVMSNRVTEIGEEAFGNCKKLVSVKMSDAIEIIPARLFYNCSALVSVNIPANVITIGPGSFYYCSSLITVTIPATCKEISTGSGATNAFYTCTKLMEVVNLSTLVIEKGTTSNGGVAQNALKVITEGESEIITDENGFMTISDTVGEGDEAVTNVMLVGYAGNSKNVTTPNGVTEIYKNAFVNHNFESVVISEGVVKIGEMAFYHNYDSTTKGALKSVTFPASLKEIAKNAFDSNTSLESIELSNVVTIGDSAFNGCTSVTKVDLGTKVETIGRNAFYNLSSVTELKLPSTLKTIGDSTFAGWKSLASVVIPQSVETIGYGAFNNNSGLTVFCEVAESEKPSGWSYSWKEGVSSVYWSFVDVKATYKLVTGYEDEGMVYDDIETSVAITLPNLSHEGYKFMGWKVEGDDTLYKGGYYNPEGATLTAVWYDYDQWVASLDGSTKENGYLAVVGEPTQYTASGYSNYWYQFTCTESGEYYVQPSSYNLGTSVYTIDGYCNSRWDSTTGLSYYSFTAGTTYYLQVYYYSAGTHSFTILMNN